MENNNFSQQPEPQAQPLQAQPVQYQQPVQQPAQYQQPVYTQYPEQQYAVPYSAPLAQPVDTEAREKTKKGNILCFISLACYLAPYLVGSILSAVTGFFENVSSSLTGTSYSVSSLVTSSVLTASYIASWVLVIIARVKYKNTFSKVLLWIYIGILVLSIIAIVLVVAFCLFACSQYQP